jgi:hypothetical protein
MRIGQILATNSLFRLSIAQMKRYLLQFHYPTFRVVVAFCLAWKRRLLTRELWRGQLQYIYIYINVCVFLCVNDSYP